MRTGSVVLAFVCSFGLMSSAMGGELTVQFRQNGAYEYGSQELDKGFETRVLYSTPLTETERWGWGVLNWCLGSPGASSPPMLSAPRLEISLGLESVMDDFDSYGGYETVMVPNGHGGYDYIQIPNGNASSVSLDLYRTRATVGLGWRILPGDLGSPPDEEDVSDKYGSIGFGIAGGLSYFSLEYGNDDDTALGVDIETYLQYEYPLLDKVRLGLRIDARIPIGDPELGNADLKTADPVQFGYGLSLSYDF